MGATVLYKVSISLPYRSSLNSVVESSSLGLWKIVGASRMQRCASKFFQGSRSTTPGDELARQAAQPIQDLPLFTGALLEPSKPVSLRRQSTTRSSRKASDDDDPLTFVGKRFKE